MARVPLAMLVLVLTLAIAGCGGGGGADETTEETITQVTAAEGDDTEAAGRELFTANCGSCHTLADAGTAGAVGPNLDTLDLTTERVEQQVRNGGGAMPAFEGTLSDDEIETVAAYVADVQGD